MIFESNASDKITPYEEYPYLVYGRVSTEKDEQVSSLENQIDICRNWIEKNHFEWKEQAIVLDEGITGTLLLDRAAMQLILQKSKKREIKMVVFKSIHRLARDMKDSLEIRETLLGHGVRVVTIEEGYDSLYEGKNDMKFEMFSMFAAQYPKTISVSVSSAMASKVRRGEHIGPIPFGYKSVDKKLQINEKEAPTIRQIFKWYNQDNIGFKTIARYLNDEILAGNASISKPRKKQLWQITSVQRIIQNPTYAGIFVYNRYTKVKIEGRKKQIQNPQEKWIIYEDHHPAIISKEEWKKANNKNIRKFKTRITPWNEFRSLLRCSECGSNMIIMQSYKKKKDGSRTEWKYLKCSAFRRGGYQYCVNHTPILYENFREFVLAELIKKGESIAVKFENNTEKVREKKIAELKKRIAILQEKNHRLIDLHIEQLITKEEFIEKRSEYEAEINHLKNDLFLSSQEKQKEMDIKSIRQAFEKLNEKDQDLHHAFKTVIDYIVVHPDGQIDFYYRFDD
ncbi:Site-specific DNA recombinase [Evansella caseinilytica]|uniref:Site-specific DNA recombinase n=1 Tax=Evansella caseinilytica TaxID=1503961 RepID=A0A1H3V198_9BACI|nr:recombinase family protein [Evansella caseinilytica]SDZ68444.1 Site-specific DNA recombinase [Evansella caseinilytica]